MERRQKFLSGLLAVVGVVFLAAGGVGLFLRVAQLRELALAVGAETPPGDHYVRFSDYAYRNGCILLLWLSSMFFVAAADPVRHDAVVRLCGWGLCGWAVFAILLGTWIAMPPPVWIVHAVAAGLLGTLVLAIRPRRSPGTPDRKAGQNHS